MTVSQIGRFRFAAPLPGRPDLVDVGRAPRRNPPAPGFGLCSGLSTAAGPAPAVAGSRLTGTEA